MLAKFTGSHFYFVIFLSVFFTDKSNAHKLLIESPAQFWAHWIPGLWKRQISMIYLKANKCLSGFLYLLFFYFYEHFSLKVFMKLDHGRSKYQKRHFCAANPLYIFLFYMFLYSAPPCLIIILTIPYPAQYQLQFARISLNFEVARDRPILSNRY